MDSATLAWTLVAILSGVVVLVLVAFYCFVRGVGQAAESVVKTFWNK